jgi:hypothetical protein
MQPGTAVPEAGRVGWTPSRGSSSGGRLDLQNSDKTHATGHGGVGDGTGWVDVELGLCSGGRLESANSDKTHATGRGGAEGGIGWVDVGLAPGLGWAAQIAKLGQDPCNRAR